MSIYVPNQGEKEMLKAILKGKAMVLGLFKTSIIPDGSTLFSTLTEWLATGGRTYAPIPLSNDLVEDAAIANKWFVQTNAAGKAEGQYGAVAQEWNFAAADAADLATAYGIFAYTWVLPFDAGAVEIKVGDVVYGSTSHATGIVTMVELQGTGTWAAGTAAGNLYIKTKTGTFQDNEEITILGGINATSLGSTGAGGTGYAVGDIFAINQTDASGGKGIVLTVNAGAVVTFGIIAPGTGYTVADNKTTTKITGSGNDALHVDVDSLATTKYAESNTGTAVPDAHQQLMFVEVFPSPGPYAITAAGQKLTYLPRFSLSTA